MDNLIDSYVLFKADNIYSYLVELNKLSSYNTKISSKYRDMIYDYLNEILIGQDIPTQEVSKKITNLSVKPEENAIYKLLVEFGITTRRELAKKKYFESFKFIVDAIKLFACIEGMTNTSKCGEVDFDSVFSKALRKLNISSEAEIKRIINANKAVFVKLFNTSLEKTNDFNQYFASCDSYIINETVVDKDSLLIDLEYISDMLISFDEKEVKFISKEYELQIFKNCLEIVCLNIIEDIMKDARKRIFLRIPDEILRKKSYLRVLMETTRVFGLKKNIILLINYNVMNSIDDLYQVLIDKGYTFALNKDVEFEKNFDLFGVKYLFLEYNDDPEFKNIIRKCSDVCELFITNRVSKGDRLKCLEFGITHFIKSR